MCEHPIVRPLAPHRCVCTLEVTSPASSAFGAAASCDFAAAFAFIAADAGGKTGIVLAFGTDGRDVEALASEDEAEKLRNNTARTRESRENQRKNYMFYVC